MIESVEPQKEAVVHIDDWNEALRLAELAEGGNEWARSDLKNLLDRCPEIWRQAGNLGNIARRAWSEALGQRHPLIAEAVDRTSRELEKSIAGPNPTPLEKLVAERIAIAEIEVTLANMNCSAVDPGATLGHRAFLQKAKGQAQRHQLDAVRTMALIRRLLPVQVSIEQSRPTLKIAEG